MDEIDKLTDWYAVVKLLDRRVATLAATSCCCHDPSPVFYCWKSSGHDRLRPWPFSDAKTEGFLLLNDLVRHL